MSELKQLVSRMREIAERDDLSDTTLNLNIVASSGKVADAYLIEDWQAVRHAMANTFVYMTILLHKRIGNTFVPPHPTNNFRNEINQRLEEELDFDNVMITRQASLGNLKYNIYEMAGTSMQVVLDGSRATLEALSYNVPSTYIYAIMQYPDQAQPLQDDSEFTSTVTSCLDELEAKLAPKNQLSM